MRKGALAVLALTATSPAHAVAPAGFCQDLRLMIQSARDSPPFASVTRMLPRPELALFGNCLSNQVGFISAVSCTWHVSLGAPAIKGLSVEALAVATLHCLPGARRREDSAAASRGEAILLFEQFAITIGRDRSIPAMPGVGIRATVAIPEG
ncbi:MAG TPA: hypothetical protein VIT38_17380 [Allosphingosinicella sp.]|jgi:hypothetical protein